MATKRSFAELEGIHASRQSLVYDKSSKPSKKPRRQEPTMPRKQAHASSVNAVKKRIRDVKRRLERAQDLPADVRAEDERALAAYQLELSAADEEKTRQKMIKKYHMVRFFERQKATRTLKKLRKRLLETESLEEVQKLKAQMHIAEVDLNYTQFYPLNERYISLYPQKGPAEEPVQDAEDAVAKKPPMWSEVERRMEEGTLDELRNGSRRGASHDVKVKQPRVSKANLEPLPSRGTKKQVEKPVVEPVVETGNRRMRRKALAEQRKRGVDSVRPTAKTVAPDNEADEGNISDGGFFDE